MDSSCHCSKPVVAATVGATTPMNFCCVPEGRFSMLFEVQWTDVPEMGKPTHSRFTFRDVFTGGVSSCELPLESSSEANKTCIRLSITSRDVSLPPSLYHVRVDLVREGHVVSGYPGSCEIYVAREGESADHVLGSFFIGRVAYAWDPLLKVHWRSIPRLPSSGDPFDPECRQRYMDDAKPVVELHPELQHDGGMAFLRAAEVFRKTGEMDRARFSETVLKRTLETILGVMMAEDGMLHGMKMQDNEWQWIYHIRQQDAFCLKLLSQSYLYFRDVAGEGKYADELFQRMEPMVRYHFSQPNPLGCGGSKCKVYDGRILTGLAYYCLTEKAAKGSFNQAHVDTTLDFARRIAEQTLKAHGWYDEGCYGEGKCHIGYGTQNALCGLLASRRIAIGVGDESLAEYLGDSIRVALDFLARTNGAITGYLQWIPTRHLQWANGNMHEILDEIKEQLGESEVLTWYYQNLWRSTYSFWVSDFHRCNILATALMESPEFKRHDESTT